MRIYVLFLVRYSILREYPLKVGVDCDEVPPVPIPNTVVKLIYVENTWRVTAREIKTLPELNRTLCPVRYSSLAQSVERMTVNHDVAGSSPAWGAS